MSNKKELNKVDINVQFEESPTRINITSGEGIKTLFGKIRKYFSDLHSVAFSGSYEDLENKPTIPEIPDISTKMDKDNPIGTGDLSIEGNGAFGGKVSVGTDITPTENNDLATKKYVDDNTDMRAVNLTLAEYEALGEYDENTYYNIIDDNVLVATEEYDGLMSKEDKRKLNNLIGIESVPFTDITGIKAIPSNNKITIKWEDPKDITWGTTTIAFWKGTKLVMKAGSYPTNILDGQLLVDNQEFNKYKDIGFTINNLNNGTTYYFSLFPYSDKNAVTNSINNRVSATPFATKIMTVKIDLSNSNPETCCSYADDAVNMTAGSSDWDEFFGHYPVLLKDGVEVGKLNPNDFTKFIDGTDADISSGDAGDVMIAFPRRGLKITTIDNVVTISITDDLLNSDFEHNAHNRGSIEKDVFYLGAYKGYIKSSKLRSLSGKTITVNYTITQFRNLAQANGIGYEQFCFYQLLFIQALYILKYKNLNSQVAVGMGLSNVSSSSATGGTETKGLDWGETTGQQHMKLFGIEDLWGNLYDWVDGIISGASKNILIGTDNFNTSGKGYVDYGICSSTDLGGYMSNLQGTTNLGFLVKETNASESTYFCDYTGYEANCVGTIGGRYDAQGKNGLFRFAVADGYNTSWGTVCARLMYL